MKFDIGDDLERQLALLPKDWINKERLNTDPDNVLHSISCASPSTSLVTFAIVNLLTLLAAFILGRATVRYRLSCRLCPKYDQDSASLPNPRSFLRPVVLLPAIIMIVLELMSSCVGAYLANAAGVMTIQALIMMALARPRGTWISIVACFGVGHLLARLGVVKEKRMWMRNYQSSHFTMIVTEVVLEIVGIIPTVYLLSNVAGWGRTHPIDRPDTYTRLLYTGAIVYVIGITITTCLLLTTGGMWVWGRLETGQLPPLEDWALQRRRLWIVKRRRRWILVSMFAFGWIPALGSWMIWIGFVHVAEGFYCSKKVVEIAVVWIVCNFLRTFCGAGW